MKICTRKPKATKADHRSGSVLRIALILVCVMAALEIGASSTNLLFGSANRPIEIYPSTSPFKSMDVGFGLIGPKPGLPPIVRLMDAANRLAGRTNVPYVFGGSQLGSANQCQQCSECIRKNSLIANSTLERYNNCAACRRCGIDCSNFVNRLFAEAGLRYRFADTRTLNHSKDGFLQEQYGFINMGTDLWSVRPGDLIMEKGHVVLVVDVDLTLGTIDFIHASRGSKRTPVGGIELRRGTSIEKLQRDVVRILRHREIVVPDDSGINLGEGRSLWSHMKQLIASNN